MRVDVLKPLRVRMVRSAAILSLTGLVAGCSGDIARFDDGFYTGAVPKSSVPSTGTYVDQTNTGSIQRGGAMGMAAPGAAYANQPSPAGVYADSAPSGSVQRGQLPPPGASGVSSYPQASAAPVYSAPASQPTPMTAAASPSQSLPEGRGAPPSTLQEQAARIAATPSSAPRRPAPQAVRTASTGTQGTGSVTVQQGDTLTAIARRSGVSTDALRRANGMAGDTVRIGQTLTLPSGASATAQPTRVASLAPTVPASPTAENTNASVAAAQPQVYQAPAAESAKGGRLAAPASETAAAAPVHESKPAQAAAVAKAEPAPVSVAEKTEVAAVAPQATGIGQFRWPVQGRVINRYGDKVGSRRNDGLNISVPRGTAIKAAENGVVIYAGDGLKEFGNTILVKHDNGLVTVYGHADQLDVKRGDTVRRGQEIGKTGMSGDTTVPMLHFEVRKDSAPVDPNKYLL